MFFLVVLASMARALPQSTQHHDGRHELELTPPRPKSELSSNSQAHVEIAAFGHLVRRENHTSGVSLLREDPRERPARIQADGVVTVVAPAETSSEQLKLEELTEECLQDEPTSECMEKFGSYGIRKLDTLSWHNIKKLGYPRRGWMSHPKVQERKLFELTLPGSVNSGTYAATGAGDQRNSAAKNQELSPYGIVSQNMPIYHQMELGIRQFDLRVAYSKENKLVFISHGTLLIPLATALQDIRRFLEEYEREIVVIDLRLDETAEESTLELLKKDDSSFTRIPGQTVHEAVHCELKDMLMTYEVLGQLPRDQPAENPTVSALGDIGASVLYFWDTQQVLCTTLEECSQTPGWNRPNHHGHPFAFGSPLALGTRINVTGGNKTARIIEPACNAHSAHYTKDDSPEKLLKKIESYSDDPVAFTVVSRPYCYPAGAVLPHVHNPTLWYTVEGAITTTPEEMTVQEERMKGVKAIYTRGEGFTVKTEAERTNYLLLNWFCKKNNQRLYTRPNAIMFEFAGGR
jgi:hypothetical protein